MVIEPTSLLTWLGIIGGGFTLLVGGIIVLIGLFDKEGRLRKKKINEDLNNSEDRLINTLKTTVEELSKKVDQQDKDIINLTKKVDDLTHEKNIYLQALQGRDEQTKEFYKQAFESMRVARETHDAVTTLVGTVTLLATNMSDLIKVLDHTLPTSTAASPAK